MEQPLSLKLASMSRISQRKLENILSKCGDQKDLLIDPLLIKPLERICDVTWLRQKGVEKIYKMDPQLGSTPNKNKVYYIPACLVKYKCVLDHISSYINQGNYNIHVIITPGVMCTFNSLLESRGLYGIVQLHSFGWELMMLDEQILSLELPFLYKQVFVQQNNSLLSSISMALWSLFYVTGKPKIFFSFGKLASKVLDVLEIHNSSYSTNLQPETSSEIGALIVIDRDQDYASTLLTPATYSGLLSEIFNINCGHLDLNVKGAKLKKGNLNLEMDETAANKSTVMVLDSTADSLYGEIKHRHFSEVLSVLSSKAKLLKNEDIKALGLQEMKHFVATKLQQITLFKQNLVNHVMACETVISEMSKKYENLKLAETEMLNNRNKKTNFTFVDDNFGTDIHIYNSLRLMCLLSLTQGLTYEEYTTLINKYLLAFGYKYLYVFHSLVNAGLLVQPPLPKLTLSIPNLSNLSDRLPRWSNSFQTTANKLKQLPSDSESKDRLSPSYVFNGGYTPLVAVICNTILTSDSCLDVINKLNSTNEFKIGGEIIENVDRLSEGLKDQSLNELDPTCIDAKHVGKVLKNNSVKDDIFPLKPKTLLVFVIGGVTFAEIAACNVIQTLTASKIIVATDCITTGADLMQANT